MRKVFDPAAVQHYLNEDFCGLQRVVSHTNEHLIDIPDDEIYWFVANSYTHRDIIRGNIVAADPELLRALEDNVAKLCERSIVRNEWRGANFSLPTDPEIVRPEAWFHPNWNRIAIKWLRTGTTDQGDVRAMMDKDLDGIHPMQGVGELLQLVPLSAWSDILLAEKYPYWHSNPALRKKRYIAATEKTVLEIAADPSQLQDPKSPMRKRIRALMRRNMAEKWLGGVEQDTAFYWLWTVEWRDGQSGLSPREVMLRAYAYMPEVDPPANIANEVASLRKIPI
jgi:hypothetical protein